MANISKFKDKKTGEVYDLGPKTWEIAFNSVDEFSDAITEGKVFTLANFAEDVQIGDKILGHVINGDMTIDFAADISFAQKMDGIAMVGTVPALFGADVAYITMEASGDTVLVLVQGI